MAGSPFVDAIPLGSSVLIKGPPGSGKTELALHLVREWLKAGEEVIYVSVSFSSEQLLERVSGASDGNRNLHIVDCYSSSGQGREGTVVYTNGMAHLESISLAISTILDGMDSPARIVVDGLSLLYLNNASQTMSKFVQILSSKTKQKGGTIVFLVVDGMHETITISTLMALADGLIEISLDSEMSRYIRLSYLKGHYTDPSWYSYSIADGMPSFSRIGLDFQRRAVKKSGRVRNERKDSIVR